VKGLRALDSITRLIVRCCDPDYILLFGSYARGTAGPDSDLDLLVVGPFKESKWLRDRELSGLLGDFAIRMDLHLVTPEELAIEAEKPHSFLRTLPLHAIRLYQRVGESRTPRG
jgi:predicted nucleotidyltransferase